MAANGQKAGSKGGGALATLCNVLGTLLLVLVVALCAPVTVPMLAGYQVYDVVSGSMEPEIPIGSVVYVKDVSPGEVKEGDVIAFYDRDGIVVHRVVINRTSLGEFVTKGDANETEDLNPIPYESFVGIVEAKIPMMGTFMAIFASTVGKVYLLLTAACGVMLNMVAGHMRAARRAREREVEAQLATAQSGIAGSGLPPDAHGAAARAGTRKKGRTGHFIRNVAIAVLAVVFVGSASVVGYVTWQHSVSDALYGDAVDKYVGPGTRTAPISIDFKKLQAQNPDVVGWIYCEDTPINYPVLQGKDNDQYLHHDYTGDYNIDGSIFVDSVNTPGFVDSNTIIYGHNMSSGSMFACLQNWADQDFYEKHPVVWLLTPEKNYKIVLFSGHHVSAYSDMYEHIPAPGEQMNRFLQQAVELSEFHPTSSNLNEKARYVMLTTCAYLFEGDRYVLHGYLVTVSDK